MENNNSPVQPMKHSRAGIASFVIGCLPLILVLSLFLQLPWIGFIGMLLMFFPLITLPLAIVGIILGIIGTHHHMKKGLSITGIILNAIVFLLAAWVAHQCGGPVCIGIGA